MFKGIPALSLAAILLVSSSSLSGILGEAPQKPALLREENARFRARVTALENQMKVVLAELVRLRPAEPSSSVSLQASLSAHEVQSLRNFVRQGKQPVVSSLDIDMYGYLKLDAAYDSSRVSVGNFARWVESEQTNPNDDEFNMTANQSRFGMKFSGPEVAGTEVTGRAEIDFYGGGSENKPNPMLRHAFLDIAWPGLGLDLLAGQTSDVISPLNPSTLNYSVAWWAGNIGYRRPQARLTKLWELPADFRLKSQIAAARTIGRSAIVGGDRKELAHIREAPGMAAIAPQVQPLRARCFATLKILSTISQTPEKRLDFQGPSAAFGRNQGLANQWRAGQFLGQIHLY